MSTAVQLALFPTAERHGAAQPARYPQAPGFKVAGTSAEAAAKITPTVDRLRDAVLEEIRRRPGTADEIAERLDRNRLAVRPRVSELKRLGKIKPTNERRRNRSRCSAMVWRAATPAKLDAAPMAST